MGNRVNNEALRVINTGDWLNRWEIVSNYVKNITLDEEIRNRLSKIKGNEWIYRVYIELIGNFVIINVFIGKIRGYGKEKERIIEVLGKEINGKRILIVFKGIERRLMMILRNIERLRRCLKDMKPYKGIIRQLLDSSLNNNRKGIKLIVSGRIFGNEIARKEMFIKGKVPINSLGFNILFLKKEVETKYGKIGIKCWINL